eukprot:COSAG04_NODE_80_length_28110_cov_13.522847_9_plen_94_part_00
MLVALLLASAAPADPADFTLAVPFTDDMVLKSGSAVRPTGLLGSGVWMGCGAAARPQGLTGACVRPTGIRGVLAQGWLGWGVGVRGCCTGCGG